MKNFIFLFLFLFCAYFSYAQRTFKDVAFDYLCESSGKVNAKNCSIKDASYTKLPNGNMVIDISIIRHVKFKEELHATDGHYFTQANGIGPVTYSKTAYKVREEERNMSFLVFCSREGTPLRYEIRPNYHTIETWNNHYWFFINKHSYNIDGLNYKVYDYINCRTMNGEPLLNLTDIMVFSILKTNNNLYLAGKKAGDEVSVVRGYDIKTAKVIFEEIGNRGSFCHSLKNSDNGIEYSEYLVSTKTNNSFIIPYEVNDKEYHFNLMMSKYDQRKASDQITIGERYLSGSGFEKNEKLAFEWFKKAASQNNSEGLYRLAKCYQKGIGVNADKAQAAIYLEKAADLNNIEAIQLLSDMYAMGDGVEKNMSKALYLKEKLAFDGNVNAQDYVLSNQSIEYTKVDIPADKVLSYARDNYLNRNYKWAMFCYERAISLGNKDAMYEYGKWLYQGSDGITKDTKKAIEFLNKLGEENYLKAQKLLIDIYRENNGVTPDAKQEMYWCMKAANNGDPESLLRMSEAYQKGIGVKKNKKLAFQMIELAASNYNEEATKKLVYSYGTGKGVKKDESKSLMWFKRLNFENQLEVAADFDKNPKIKCTVGIVMNMYEHLAKKNYQAMKRFAELSVEYGKEYHAIDAINMLESATHVDYSRRNADIYMLWGKLRERQGRIGDAIQCYRNSGTFEGSKRADYLNRNINYLNRNYLNRRR